MRESRLPFVFRVFDGALVDLGIIALVYHEVINIFVWFVRQCRHLSTVKQTQNISRRFFRHERNFFKVVREGRADELGVIGRKPVQESLHLVAIDAEDRRRAHAGGIRIVHQVRQTWHCRQWTHFFSSMRRPSLNDNDDVQSTVDDLFAVVGHGTF